MLGRLVYYFASAMAVVLFPMAAATDGENKESFRLLSKSIFYNSILAFGSIVVLNLGGKFIVRICYGELYMEAIQYILPTTCMIFPMNIITLIINFLLAQNKGNHIIGVTLIGLLVEVLCVNFSQNTLLSTVWMMTLIVWLILIADVVLLIRMERRMPRGVEET